jgi:fucose 4-O-acetylase-like acetyltransferase
MARPIWAIANLRALTILFVVSFHSVLAYLGSQPTAQPPFDSPPYSWLSFPIQDREKWFGFDLYCAFQYVFLMPLFFFISGLFVWPSLARRGAKAFAYVRVLRIGVPFVLGAAILMPLAHYPVYRVTASDPSWSAFWEHWTALPFWAAGPLWFLWQILLLDLIAAALFRFVPGFGRWLDRASAGASEAPGRAILAFAAVSVAVYLPLASLFKPWHWSYFGPFSIQTAQAPLFALYFFGGVAAGARELERGLLNPSGILARRFALWLALAVAAFAGWLAVTALTVKSSNPPALLEGLSAVMFAVSSVTSCLAIVSAFLRFANGPIRGTASLSANAYAIYLVHYFFVVWLQYLLLGVALVAPAKGALVFLGALASSWIVALALARIPVAGPLIFGERRAPPGPSLHPFTQEAAAAQEPAVRR